MVPRSLLYFWPLTLSIVTSSWYNKEENPTRMAIWHAGNTISNIISGFLAAGILENMDGVAGLHAWKWFCKFPQPPNLLELTQISVIIEGAVSILVALVAFFVLPDWPVCI